MPSAKRRAGRQSTASGSKRRKVATENDDGRPTEAEWDGMARYKRFQIQQKEEIHPFAVDDVVLILPPGATPGDKDLSDDDFWMGRIQEIRTDESADIWTKIQWFYKPEDLPAKVKGFNRSICGHKERLASNHEDLVHYTSCEDVVRIQYYDEKKLQHPPVDEDYYYRYTYDCRKNTVSHVPKVCTPKCNKGYSPEDVDGVMRVCPSCSGVFHTACLRKHKTSERDSIPTTPDSPASVRTLVATPSHSKEAKQHPAVPKHLQTLARLPLLKGGPHGVAGNAQTVLSARALVAEWHDSKMCVAKWQERLGGAAVVRATLDAAEDAAKRAYSCPACAKSM